VVHVDFGKSELALGSIFIGQLGKLRSDGAAGRTPVGVKVDNDVRGR
jgi:hypothetical protein